MQVFTENIEEVILEHFDNAKNSIVIVIAWFTREKIVSKLVELRKYRNIQVQILIDDNYTNRTYFIKKYASTLKENGIDIKDQQNNKFNHNKFAIIDNITLITGSYNFTDRATKNLENIIVENDERIANYYFRLFKFFTEKNYIDPNIEILYHYFTFSNQLLSNYYPFSSKLLSKLEDKVIIGYCYTHENGYHNEIAYEPGLIFNPRFKFHKKLKRVLEKQKKDKYSLELLGSELTQEFELPITKQLIMNYKAFEINNFNYQSMRELAFNAKYEIDFEQLGNDFQETENAIKSYYTRKFQDIYSMEELTAIIEKKKDIIIEDYIWTKNFAPFLNDSIVEDIYAKNLGNT